MIDRGGVPLLALSAPLVGEAGGRESTVGRQNRYPSL